MNEKIKRFNSGTTQDIDNDKDKLIIPSDFCAAEHRKIRRFNSGATRDIDNDKIDYEGFLSPLVLQAFGEYMNKHRYQSNGAVRDSDNWQKGIPKDVYMKSALRHIHDLWMEHRKYKSRDGIDSALGGLLFNVMGYWFELLKERRIQGG
jgi:hypothetical protein